MIRLSTPRVRLARIADVTGDSSPGLRWALPSVLIALLVACGGGGGGGGDGPVVPADEVNGPPTVAAVLGNTPTEAAQSVQAVVAGSDAAAARASSLSGLSVLLGGPVGPLQARGRVVAAALSPAHAVHPLAVQSAGCADLLDPPCTGSATLDTNVADTATAVGPGDYADLRFSGLSGGMFGQQVALYGRMRIDFLSAVDLNATTFPGLDLKLKLEGFGGSLNGQNFGPVSDTGRLQIDSLGVATLIAGGASYTGLADLSVQGGGSYVLGSGQVRVAYWSDSARYVDLALQGWQVAGNRPAVGSRAVVSAGDGRITIRVSASSAGSVVYDATVVAGGATSRYVVTGTYPAGGGAPTYASVPAV